MRRRGGYTLLEVTLALGIALMLLGALYWSLTTFLGLAESGRDKVRQGVAARSILDRMNADILGQLAFAPAAPTSDNPQTTGGQTTSGQTTGGQTTSGQTTSGQTTGGQTTSGQTTGSQASGDSAPPVNVGVYGTPNTLRLLLSRYPREVFPMSGDAPVGVSDLRRIDYWLVTDGATVRGLARREITGVTSDAGNADPASLPADEQNSFIIAGDVTNMTIRYWDGASWSDSTGDGGWDGTKAGSDGETPIGPPAAIEITLELRTRPARGGQSEKIVKYRHVVAIPGANIGQQGANAQ